MNTDLGENEEGVILATTHTSDSKVVPIKNKSENCISCGARIEQIYCGTCGQKNDDLRRSLWRLIGESLGGIFSFESRVWRTWGALLFKPGKVAREYANGARTKYSSPIRVYLVVSFLFFAFLAFTQTNLFAMTVKPSPKKAAELGIDVPVQEETGNMLILNDYSYSFLFFQTQNTFEKASDPKLLKIVTDSLEAEAKANIVEDDQTAIAGFTQFLKHPNQFNTAFNTWLPRVLFFMVPVAMLLGAIFIRGPTALLYDHLIHAIYIHAMFFSSLLIAIFLSKITSGVLVAQILMIVILIYLILSVKRMFKRGWFKTILMTFCVGGAYLMILFISIIGITVTAAMPV